MSDIGYRPAHALAEAIRRRELSSRELLEHYLARVDRLNPALNAVVTLDADGARQAADAADEALARGDVIGPLHGVPMTIKDCYDTAGMRTTCGVEDWDCVPERDAEAVRRFRDAGAVIFGKTNTPAFTADWQTYNPMFGTTNNPWDTTCSSGGSSGGSAAALAAGLTALELGSDIAGSIRVPSNWCGTCGHKPSFGVVPQRGHLPSAPGALADRDLNVVGPMARDVDDLEMALDILAGPAGDQAKGWRLELPPARATALSELRLALWLDDPAYPVEGDVQEVLETTVTALRKAGARFVDASPPVTLAELVPLHMELLYPVMEPSSEMLHRNWLSVNEKRERLRVRIAEFFREVDAMLMPVAVVAAIPHTHDIPLASRVVQTHAGSRPYLDMFGWVGLATVAYLPATVVPVGRTQTGLPVGIQIVGPYLEDRTTLSVARCIEELLGGFVPPPGY
ncbi:amidase, Asp-tRNAAsn/Glu-tRNAGln amidotransferase A subunit [Mycobacterium sp. JS623]|uniref:amidase family protein n=1 Tax=Mycobacterium sp. JS623 TaxID=212767 RepID=UPI0002A59D9F|nr:amidase family protein [Mycobacterium sp. JS623]AGB24708.1 amidase, Asp-tRNAAsn/Glu-tRNAGln amidotransferase A subunit [Mycobacterium sp. JS623]